MTQEQLIEAIKIGIQSGVQESNDPTVYVAVFISILAILVSIYTFNKQLGETKKKAKNTYITI